MDDNELNILKKFKSIEDHDDYSRETFNDLLKSKKLNALNASSNYPYASPSQGIYSNTHFKTYRTKEDPNWATKYNPEEIEIIK